MKRVFTAFVLVIISAGFVYAGGYGVSRVKAPRVEHYSPSNQAVVDLTGKDSLKFEWKRTPIPSGGRVGYRFVLYKGMGYDVVVKETLDPGTFSIEVPSSKFEDGIVYSWHVQQRDGQSMEWSIFTNWSFKVIKKSGT